MSDLLVIEVLMSDFGKVQKEALAFYSLHAAQIAERNETTNDYNHNQEQEISDEEYDYQYEKERFTDTYTEDFRDDYNKPDRFTDDNAYHENFTDDYH
jgi:hypothetical protein